MKYSFDELTSARVVIGVFYVHLINFPFNEYDEQIKECRKRLKRYLNIVEDKCGKYANLCRIYDLYLRFKEIKFKKKNIWLQLNTCNYLMRWIDEFHRGDVDNWYLQARHWEDYHIKG